MPTARVLIVAVLLASVPSITAAQPRYYGAYLVRVQAAQQRLAAASPVRVVLTMPPAPTPLARSTWYPPVLPKPVYEISDFTSKSLAFVNELHPTAALLGRMSIGAELASAGYRQWSQPTTLAASPLIEVVFRTAADHAAARLWDAGTAWVPAGNVAQLAFSTWGAPRRVFFGFEAVDHLGGAQILQGALLSGVPDVYQAYVHRDVQADAIMHALNAVGRSAAYVAGGRIGTATYDVWFAGLNPTVGRVIQDASHLYFLRDHSRQIAEWTSTLPVAASVGVRVTPAVSDRSRAAPLSYSPPVAWNTPSTLNSLPPLAPVSQGLANALRPLTGPRVDIRLPAANLITFFPRVDYSRLTRTYPNGGTVPAWNWVNQYRPTPPIRVYIPPIRRP